MNQMEEDQQPKEELKEEEQKEQDIKQQIQAELENAEKGLQKLLKWIDKHPGEYYDDLTEVDFDVKELEGQVHAFNRCLMLLKQTNSLQEYNRLIAICNKIHHQSRITQIERTKTTWQVTHQYAEGEAEGGYDDLEVTIWFTQVRHVAIIPLQATHSEATKEVYIQWYFASNSLNRIQNNLKRHGDDIVRLNKEIEEYTALLQKVHSLRVEKLLSEVKGNLQYAEDRFNENSTAFKKAEQFIQHWEAIKANNPL